MLIKLEDVASIRGRRAAKYRCDCGIEIIALVANVNSGHTSSCGCYRRKATGERSRKHGQRSGPLHKGKRPQGYAAWVNMRQRCTNQKSPDFKNYGGRGITYCRRWEVFEAFIEDMGVPKPRMTLDRIDNSLGYSPENCRWISRAVQNLNKRNCVRYEMNGESKTLAEWARITGIGRVTMLKRIQRGWPVVRALTEAPAY